jgi:hypothetical protein
MQTFLTSVFGRSNRRPETRSTGSRSIRLRVEGLEKRDCPATVGFIGYVLHAEMKSALNQLARDGATVEVYRPTVARNQLARDLVRVYADAQSDASNSMVSVIIDLNTLRRDLISEFRICQAYRLSSSGSLLSYSRFVGDLVRVTYDEVTTIAFAEACASALRSQRQSHPPLSLQNLLSNPLSTQSDFGNSLAYGTSHAVASPSFLKDVDNIYTNYMNGANAMLGLPTTPTPYIPFAPSSNSPFTPIRQPVANYSPYLGNSA